uniref:AI-2E family transporter n=1 Tax=Pectobacterium cacticida TaxID=69221 RepID=UPI00366D415C
MAIISAASFWVCLILGVIAGISFWVFGLPYPLILGLISGVTNVIPYFGPFIGAVPALLIAMTISVKAVLVVVITVFILQFMEGNILSPFIVGRSLKNASRSLSCLHSLPEGACGYRRDDSGCSCDGCFKK